MKRSYKSFKRSYPRNFSKRSAIPRPMTIKMANKCVDVLEGTTNLNTTASFTLINGIVQGSAYYQRLGNRFAMKALLLKAMLIPKATNSSLLEAMRVMLVYDRQANGAAPTFSDIVQGRAQDGTTDAVVLSNQNIDKRSRYLVLYDFWQPLPQITVTGTVVTNVGEAANVDAYKLQKLITLPNLVTQCDGATAGIGDIETGSLYLITYGTNALNSDSHQINWSARLFFYDAAN